MTIIEQIKQAWVILLATILVGLLAIYQIYC